MGAVMYTPSPGQPQDLRPLVWLATVLKIKKKTANKSKPLTFNA